MMSMTVSALSDVKVDCKAAFKSVFVTNELDGSEDHLVSNKLFNLVGQEMVSFREELMKEKSPKLLTELLKTITPPKGIKRKNGEGTELLDCEGDEILELVEHEDLDLDDGKIFEHFWYKQDVLFVPKSAKKI